MFGAGGVALNDLDIIFNEGALDGAIDTAIHTGTGKAQREMLLKDATLRGRHGAFLRDDTSGSADPAFDASGYLASELTNDTAAMSNQLLRQAAAQQGSGTALDTGVFSRQFNGNTILTGNWRKFLFEVGDTIQFLLTLTQSDTQLPTWASANSSSTANALNYSTVYRITLEVVEAAGTNWNNVTAVNELNTLSGHHSFASSS